MREKKIGIITWYGSCNYGTNIQAFALLKYLTKTGYNCCILNISKYLLPPKIEFIKSFIYKMRNDLSSYKKASQSKQKIKIANFVNNDLNIYYCRTKYDYRQMMQSFSLFMTGGDQIWNPYYLNTTYLLDFAKDKKRIAYATSIGVNEIPRKKVTLYKKNLSKFSTIGMREQTAVNIIKTILPNKKVYKVLDPTFLLSKQEWIEFANNADIEFEIPKSYIFCYLIGKSNNYISQIKDIWLKTGINNLIIMKSAENGDFSIDGAFAYKDGGPKEFIKLLSQASLICTDSFHASALSINMSLNFIEFMRFDNKDEQSQNSRINELLTHYYLTNRIYKHDMNVNKDIEYLHVQNILDKDRILSMKYLIESIENR
jgi:hypothetical protein